MMTRQAVRSRDLAIIGYELETSTLEVAFRSGGVYRYTGVPSEVHQKLIEADSMGTYFQQHIKEKYGYSKVQ